MQSTSFDAIKFKTKRFHLNLREGIGWFKFGISGKFSSEFLSEFSNEFLSEFFSKFLNKFLKFL